MAISLHSTSRHAAPAALQSPSFRDFVFFVVCKCDRVRERKRESETEKISNEKRRMQKEKPAAVCQERDFKVKVDLTVQKSSRGWPSFGLVGMQALHCLMDKTGHEENKKKPKSSNLASNLGFHSRII